MSSKRKKGEYLCRFEEGMRKHNLFCDIEVIDHFAVGSP